MTTEVKKLKKDAYNNEEKVVIPPVDVYETDEAYVLKADMPGVKKEDINITLDNNRLEISGKVHIVEEEGLKYREYELNNYHREFTVTNNINGDAISAALTNGILTLNLPKREEIKPRKVEISVN